MAVIDEFVANNKEYADRFPGPLPMQPSRKIAIVACMDARIDLFDVLGLKQGDAHVLRNAGGVVTDDVVRSLAISQRLQDTRSVMLLHHTECGLLTYVDDEFKAEIEAETGARPPWPSATFDDLAESMRRSIQGLRDNPILLHRDDIRGFVYDVTTGRLHEVSG